MKLKTNYGYIINVFGIYWIKSLETNITHTYLYALPPNQGGIVAYSLDDKNNQNNIEIIDPIIDWRSVYFCNELAQGIYHWALIEERLLDDVVDHDEEAYKRFLEIIKSEGLVDKDFY